MTIRVATAALLASLAGGGAHPGHETFAEAEVNADAGTLEVALRVDSMDLERALRAGHPRPPRLEDPAVEPLLARELRQAFLVRSRRGFGRLDFVGYELEGLDAWLYFEIDLPRRGRRLELSNQLLFALHPGQRHRVQLRALDGERTLEFDAEHPWRVVTDLAWRPEHLRPFIPSPMGRAWLAASFAPLFV